MPADASPAATDRPEPAGRVGVERRETGVTVPPPRSAPAVEAAPPAARPTSGPGDRAGAAEGRPGAPADGSAAEAAPADGLTERERRILAFEQQWWKHAGAKEQAIRDTFGLSATRYYQLLNALLDQPAALAAEPVLVARLRRLRASRARNRRR